MSIRVPCAALAVLGLLVGTAVAQQPARADLERRLGELEKQLGQLLKEVKDLRKDLPTAAPAGLPRMEIKIFPLRNADAIEMTRILNEILQDRDGRTMRLTADPRTNSLIVYSRADLLEMIEAVVGGLEEGWAREKSAEPVKKPARPGGQRRAALEERIGVALAEVIARRERAAWAQRMAKLGYLSQSQVQADAAQLQSAEVALERVKAELQALPADPSEPGTGGSPKK